MEPRAAPRSSRARLVVLMAVLAALVGTHGGETGKGGRKIIIHVPYYIKNHHHTHTVFKYVKPGKDHHSEGDTESVGGGAGEGDGGEGGASLEQGHHGEGGDGLGGGGDISGEQHGDFFHSSQPEDLVHHDEGATQDSPQALALHGEPPRPVHAHHGDSGDSRSRHGAGDGRSHHGGYGENRGHNRSHQGIGYLHHRQHLQQRVREDKAHLHREERTRHHHRNNNNNSNNNHHHHHGHHDYKDDGREHAHFHTKFTVGENDGQVHEADSSESSELSGHDLLEGHRAPREHDYHNRYEVADHDSFDKRPMSEERHLDDFEEEGRHHGSHTHHGGYNGLQTELRPDESQHYSSPAFAKEQTPPYDRYRNEKYDDRFVPRETRGFRKHKGKRFDEKPRRQKYEVEEPNQESSPSREIFSSHENPPDYEPRRRKHNFDWR